MRETTSLKEALGYDDITNIVMNSPMKQSYKYLQGDVKIEKFPSIVKRIHNCFLTTMGKTPTE